MPNHNLGDFPGEPAELQLPITGGVDVTNFLSPRTNAFFDAASEGLLAGWPPAPCQAPHCPQGPYLADWSSTPSQIPQDPHLADWLSAPYQAPQAPHLIANEGPFGTDWSSAPPQISQGTPYNVAQQFTTPIPAALIQHPTRGGASQPIIYGVPQRAMASSAPASQVIATMPGSSAPQTAEDDRIRCPKGCPKTFRRAGDYRRHMKKHDEPTLKCVVIKCDKKFYRLDKLRIHVRSHGINL